jgi:hypothetical protein
VRVGDEPTSAEGARPSACGAERDGPTRFFPRGAVCARCGYDLRGSEPGTCPECGEVTTDLAADGRVRPLTDEEREIVDRWAAEAPRRPRPADFLNLRDAGLLPLLIVLLVVVLVVFPLFRSVDSPRGVVPALLYGVVRLLALLGVMALAHVGLTFRKFRTRGRQREAALRQDLEGGVVDEHLFPVSHAMRVSGPEEPHLLLKIPNGVLGLTPRAQRLVRPEVSKSVGERCRIAVLPASGVPVGIVFEGRAVPIAERPDLFALGWWHEGSEPVWSARSAGQLIAMPRGALPAFASRGEEAPPRE